MNEDVAVIGSGLAAVAVCKALIEIGIKPTVLDVGRELPAKNNQIAMRLSQQNVQDWDEESRDFINQNTTIHGRQHPKKLLFGSDYFYGCPQDADILCDQPEKHCPPFSFAKGGFSVGWGASVLFPDQCDLVDWPISASELVSHFKAVMQELPYSAAHDGLSLNFPLMKEDFSPINPTHGNQVLLNALSASGLLAKNEVVFGQSRLLLETKSCQYCGGCLSGCVYDAIYKSNKSLDAMIQAELIVYHAGIHVDKVEDATEGGYVLYKDTKGVNNKRFFKRIFMAAGAVNSTAIVMKSKQLYQQSATIKTTLSFIAPLLSLKKLALDWPNNNTMPGIFFEFKAKAISQNWIHTQLSTPNELVLNKLGIHTKYLTHIQKIKRRLAEHFVIAHGNMHSTHANHYTLTLNKNRQDEDVFTAQRTEPEQAKKAVKNAVNKLATLTPAFGCYVLKLLVQDTTQAHGYHLGGSLPMKKNPQTPFDTDTLGRPFGWNHVHVVDSSIFPSIPATTVGVLAMANARRITLESMAVTK